MRRRPSPWLGALLAFALLGLQALGLTHRVAHAPAAVPALVAGVGPHHQVEAPDGHDPARWDVLFGHDSAGEDCRLFDQLALGDLAPEVLDTSAAAPSQACDGRVPAAPRAAFARRAHQARAPPLAA